MKNRFKIFGLLMGMLLFFGSCEEQQLIVYEHENNIYFPTKSYLYYLRHDGSAFSPIPPVTMVYNGETYRSPAITYASSPVGLDSLGYSMINGDIVVIPVMAMGAIADHDRKVEWKVINQDVENAGKLGVDFEVLDAYIPANSMVGGLIVKLFRENLNEDNFLYADFELLPNENFQTNFSEIPRRAGSNELVSTTTIRLRYYNFLQKPQYWDLSFLHLLGPWSNRKVFILVEHFNFDTSADFLYKVPPPHTMEIFPFGIALKRWLEDYEIANGAPYYERDGVTKMTWGNYMNSTFN